MDNTAQCCPFFFGDLKAEEGSAGELRPVVGAHRLRVAPEPRRLVQQPRDVFATDAEVHRDVHALVAEVVGHPQALQPAAIAQAVRDEVHAPGGVDLAGRHQRRARPHRASGLGALAHGQVCRAV